MAVLLFLELSAVSSKQAKSRENMGYFKVDIMPLVTIWRSMGSSISAPQNVFWGQAGQGLQLTGN